jgi:long-subunit acyl-CoA synthetase (AMP-forming)
LWKSYKEVYDEVLQIGSALQQLGVKPVRPETSISILGFTPNMFNRLSSTLSIFIRIAHIDEALFDGRQ